MFVYWTSRAPVLLRMDEDEIRTVMDHDLRMVRWVLAIVRSWFEGAAII
jgi:hypothetical protein